MTLEQVFQLATQLSPRDKLRFIQQITPQLEQELVDKPPLSRRSLWGLCADISAASSAEEIDLARSEEFNRRKKLCR
ncbi:MAG: hypothetical protein SAJ37_07445 [Oscillatoria sp. PMC 1068.18]|nr:hypothetical protein [Oscillatoria sp. PMC 1076.18]MEC4988568.1 hypothetical protein [Oscillatoria sp. PMC 1068.18]